jgi:hypothetical protein
LKLPPIPTLAYPSVQRITFDPTEPLLESYTAANNPGPSAVDPCTLKFVTAFLISSYDFYKGKQKFFTF